MRRTRTGRSRCNGAPTRPPYISEDAPEQFRARLADPDQALFILESVEDPRPIGFIYLAGLATADEGWGVEFRRFAIAEPGRGFGAAALTAVQDPVFRTSPAHRLWLDVLDGDDRAYRLYQRAGFRYEGRVREATDRITGERADLLILSILRREWEALSGI